jgi:foldase protein PrsA
MGRVALFLCVLALPFTGCKKDEVARVNGVPITRTQLVDQLEKDFGTQVVQQLVGRMVVDQAFQQSGLQLPPQMMEKAIKDWREEVGGEQASQQWLAMQGLTEDDWRKVVEYNLKLTLIAQKDIQVTEAALRDYYKENEPRYREPRRIAFSEIALPTQQQADDVRKMAVRPGASFADLAKKYSIAPTRDMGGRRDTTAENRIAPGEVREILLKLKANEVSRAVRVGSVWFIVQLHQIIPEKKKTFEEAREAVEWDYKGEKQKVSSDAVGQQLISQATVRIVDPKYAQLQRIYAGADLLRSAPGAQPSTGVPGAAPKADLPGAPKGEAPAAPKAETK